MKSISLGYLFWVKVGQSFLDLFRGSNRVMFVRNPLLFEVAFTFSFKTLRYFSRGPSPLCSSTRLLRTLLLNLGLLDLTS